MKKISNLKRRPATDEELELIAYGLRSDASAWTHKKTLQRLCELLEAGRIITSPGDIRQLIHSHLHSQDVLVRRWAIKSLALIRNRDDFRRIADRLRVEDDVEAHTWGVTGLVAIAREKGLRDVCAAAGLERTAALTLAARLYAPDEWIRSNGDDLRITLHDEELALKWAAFLIGYDRAPEDLFHPRHSNAVFLGELNAHASNEIREYSIWALWERRQFGATYLRIPLDEAKGEHESVRKWLYRLAAQGPNQVGFDSDTLSEFCRDESPRAREGLALGVADLDADDFASEVMAWFSNEEDPGVREALLESMARRSFQCPDYADIVERAFRVAAPNSLTRRRLLVASQRLPLFGSLRAVSIADDTRRQGLLSYQHVGDLIMPGGNKASFGGNLNAQNVAFGDMIASANGAIQQLNQNDPQTAEILKDMLELVHRSGFEGGKQEVLGAIRDFAERPAQESKQTLLQKLRSYSQSALSAGKTLVGIDKLIDSISNLPV